MGKNTNHQRDTRKNGHQRTRRPAHAQKGTLLIIGGHEDKEGDKLILREVAKYTGSGTLIVATLASKKAAAELWENYRQVFSGLGVKQITHLHITQREQAQENSYLDVISLAGAIFFTGGDQLELTRRMGGTLLCDRIQEFYYKQGGTIAGTSAGASVMSDTMLIAGNGDESPKIGDTLRMAPGLGFLKDMIIDQHFTERGRLGRLIAAVAQNPRLLGVGIDEDTAIVVEGEECFRVLGSGAVYVIDGRGVTETNISEPRSNHTLSIFDIRLHLLSQGQAFDLKTCRPIIN